MSRDVSPVTPDRGRAAGGCGVDERCRCGRRRSRMSRACGAVDGGRAGGRGVGAIERTSASAPPRPERGARVRRDPRRRGGTGPGDLPAVDAPRAAGSMARAERRPLRWQMFNVLNIREHRVPGDRGEHRRRGLPERERRVELGLGAVGQVVERFGDAPAGVDDRDDRVLPLSARAGPLGADWVARGDAAAMGVAESVFRPSLFLLHTVHRRGSGVSAVNDVKGWGRGGGEVVARSVGVELVGVDHCPHEVADGVVPDAGGLGDGLGSDAVRVAHGGEDLPPLLADLVVGCRTVEQLPRSRGGVEVERELCLFDVAAGDFTCAARRGSG